MLVIAGESGTQAALPFWSRSVHGIGKEFHCIYNSRTWPLTGFSLVVVMSTSLREYRDAACCLDCFSSLRLLELVSHDIDLVLLY